MNFFEVATKLWYEIKDLDEEFQTDEIIVAILVNNLIKMHRQGYKSAKDFYQDKPAGWGKTAIPQDSGT